MQHMQASVLSFYKAPRLLTFVSVPKCHVLVAELHPPQLLFVKVHLAGELGRLCLRRIQYSLLVQEVDRVCDLLQNAERLGLVRSGIAPALITVRVPRLGCRCDDGGGCSVVVIILMVRMGRK